MDKIVYALLHPDSGVPFYIGMGDYTRPYDHMRLAKHDRNEHKKNTIRKILAEGKEPIIKVLYDGLSKEQAYGYEIILIHTFGRKGFDEDGILTNLQPGGSGSRGPIRTQESYERVAEHCRENNRNPEVRVKNSEAQKRLLAKNPLAARRNWRRWYISPYGCFSTKSTKELIGFDLQICHPAKCDMTITEHAFKQCKALNQIYSWPECSGKTYRQLGFHYKEI